MALTINGTTGIETNTDTGKIKVGASDDLTIEHSDTGNLSSITHSGAGKFDIVSTGDDLNIKSSENVVLMTNDTEIGVYVIKNGTVKLYHDNTEQCSTSANGLAFPSGKGIDFSATSDGAGTDSSELLDDYEEGTFSPVLGGSTNHGSYNITGNGDYVKIGKMVSCHISFSNKDLSDSAGGTVRIAGLPYTSAGVEYTVTTNHYMYHVDFNTSRIQSWYLHTGSTEMDGIESVADGGWVSWPVTDFNRSGMYLRIQMNYLVA